MSVERVEDLLKSLGFQPSGSTPSVTMPTAATHAAGPFMIGGRTSPGRKRWSLPGTGLRVTVGARTICVYRVRDRTVTDSKNVPTSDIDGLAAILASPAFSGP